MTFGLNRRRVVEATRTWTFSPLLQPTGFQPVVVEYNSAILSRLLENCEASPNPKILALIKKLSPVAWRHIHLNGHYTFRGSGQVIDLDAIVAGLVLE